MSMNIIIIVIKITITETMKITILLKLMKIPFQRHNPKTYLCSNSDNAQQEVQKNFLASSIAAPSATQQGTKNKDLHNTFFSIKTKWSHSFQGTSPVIFSLKTPRWISFVNKCYWYITYETIMVAAAKMLMWVLLHTYLTTLMFPPNCSI